MKSIIQGKLPEGLRLSSRDVPAADGRQVPLYLFRLPDGSDMEMVAVPAGDFVMGTDDPRRPTGTSRAHPPHGTLLLDWPDRLDPWAIQGVLFRDRTEPNRRKPISTTSWLGNMIRHPVIMVSWVPREGLLQYGPGARVAGRSRMGEGQRKAPMVGSTRGLTPWDSEECELPRCIVSRG